MHRLRTLIFLISLAGGSSLVAAGLQILLVDKPPLWAKNAVNQALEKGPIWSGSLDDLHLDLYRSYAIVQGLHLVAIDEGQVLREIEIPVAWVDWSWLDLIRRRPYIDVVAIGPRIEARARPGHLPKPDPPVPEDPWMPLVVDTTFVDGTWVWHDPERVPQVELELYPVDGTFNHLGTEWGPAFLELIAFAPGGGTVEVSGRLDFWNADRNAYDLALELHDLHPEAFARADEAYAGIRLARGRFDGTFATTWDPGRQELPSEGPFAVGEISALDRGHIRLRLEGHGIVLEDAPIEEVALDELILAADGPLVGSEPFEVSASGAGLDLHVRRSDLATLSSLPNTRHATLDETLKRLPAFRIPRVELADASLQFSDDLIQPPARLLAQGLELTLEGFDNVSTDDTPTRVRLRGEVIGGAIDVDASVEALTWPPELSVSAELVDVSLLGIAGALDSYGGVQVERGVLSARIEAHTEGDALVGDAVLHGADIVAHSNGWKVAVGEMEVELIDGLGWARGILALPEHEGPLLRLEASSAQVVWAMDRLLERGEMVASVQAQRPLVMAQRPKAGASPPAPGKARWSLDLHATDGRLVWDDPEQTPGIQLVMDPFDARVFGLGTLQRQARWELSGELLQGGRLSGWARLDAFGGPGSASPMQMYLRGARIPLDKLQDVTQAYLGLGFDEGTASVVLAMDEHGGQMMVRGRELKMADPPVEELRAERLDASFAWSDVLGPSSRVLKGRARGLQVKLDAAELGGPGPGVELSDDPLAQLPSLQVPYFDVEDSTLTVVSPLPGVEQDLIVRDLRLAIRDLQTGAQRSRDARIGAKALLGGGDVMLEARLPPGEAAALWLQAEHLDLKALDPWLYAVSGLDVDAGRLDALAQLKLSPSGAMDGDLRLGLRGVDVLQSNDLQEGLGTWLKSAGVGLVIDLLKRDGQATLLLPLEGSPGEMDLRLARAVRLALGRRFGLSRRSPPLLRRPDPLPLPVVEGATAMP
ncbi:MAG TPA: DUF748 domain-containing protein [Deltaproteobacteria bacterium]|nr:DUF748 domain-containing protein [Deltaproteobacteria bacterium]